MTGIRPHVRAVLARPGLWLEALRAAAAMTPLRWWRRRPPLPVPDGSYLEWRTATAYGRADADADADDVAAYLGWRKRQRAR